MDKDRFDDIVVAFAGDADRRTLLKRLAGGVLGGVAALGVVGADARRRPRGRCLKEGKTCSTTSGKACCDGLTCTDGTCQVSPPPRRRRRRRR